MKTKDRRLIIYGVAWVIVAVVHFVTTIILASR